MAKYGLGEQAQVVYIGGSPFGTASGAANWFGFVQEHTPEENEGIEAYRYVGGTNGDRNVEDFIKGTKTFTGVVRYDMQDGQFLTYAVGSVANTGSPAYKHTISELASTGGILPYFTVEDAHQTLANEHFTRTLNGCTVSKLTISSKEKEKVQVAVEYVAKNGIQSSGAATAVTANTARPYRHEMALLNGSNYLVNGNYGGMKQFSWSIDNDLHIPYTADGANQSGANERTAQQPIPQQRNYGFDFTLNTTAGTGGDLYEVYRAGSPMNFDLFLFRSSGADATLTTDKLQIWMSGARMVSCKEPTKTSGVLEQVTAVIPQSCGVVVRDSTENYPVPLYV